MCPETRNLGPTIASGLSIRGFKMFQGMSRRCLKDPLAHFEAALNPRERHAKMSDKGYVRYVIAFDS